MITITNIQKNTCPKDVEEQLQMNVLDIAHQLGHQDNNR